MPSNPDILLRTFQLIRIRMLNRSNVVILSIPSSATKGLDCAGTGDYFEPWEPIPTRLSLHSLESVPNSFQNILFSEFPKVPGFRDLSTMGGFGSPLPPAGLKGWPADIRVWGSVGGLSTPGIKGPSKRPGVAVPNCCTTLRRSFSSSWRLIMSSKAWNCSCSACCCFMRATLCLSSSSCCCRAKVWANSSSCFFWNGKRRVTRSYEKWQQEQHSLGISFPSSKIWVKNWARFEEQRLSLGEFDPIVRTGEQNRIE